MSFLSKLINRLLGQSNSEPKSVHQVTPAYRRTPAAPARPQAPALSLDQERLLLKGRQIGSLLDSLRPLRESHIDHIRRLKLLVKLHRRAVLANQDLALAEWTATALDRQSDFLATCVEEEFDAQNRTAPTRWQDRGGMWHVESFHYAEDEPWDDSGEEDDLELDPEAASPYGFQYHLPDPEADFVAEVAEAEGLCHVAFGPFGLIVAVSGADRAWWTRDAPEDLVAALEEVGGRGAGIRNVSFGPAGGWVVLSRDSSACYDQIPPRLAAALESANHTRMELTQVAFAPNGGWVVANVYGEFLADSIPNTLQVHLAQLKAQGARLEWVAFTPEGGWLTLSAAPTYEQVLTAEGIECDLEAALRERIEGKQTTAAVAFLHDGGWIMLGYYW